MSEQPPFAPGQRVRPRPGVFFPDVEPVVAHCWRANGIWWVQIGRGGGAVVMPASKLEAD